MTVPANTAPPNSATLVQTNRTRVIDALGIARTTSYLCVSQRCQSFGGRGSGGLTGRLEYRGERVVPIVRHESMPAQDAVALRWTARLFLAIGIGAALAAAFSGVATLRFISESRRAEGTVVDWTQGDWQTGRRTEPGAYYRVIEVVLPDGQRIRGEAERGVAMNQLEIGERLEVRYRPSDPARMRVVSLAGMWLKELVLAALAITFGGAGWFLLAQSKKA